MSLKHNLSSQEIENNFDLLLTLERCIETLVVQRVNRKSCIWYNMYLCSGINKISHLLESGVSDPCKDKYVADFLGSPEEFVDDFRYYRNFIDSFASLGIGKCPAFIRCYNNNRAAAIYDPKSQFRQFC